MLSNCRENQLDWNRRYINKVELNWSLRPVSGLDDEATDVSQVTSSVSLQSFVTTLDFRKALTKFQLQIKEGEWLRKDQQAAEVFLI